MFHPDFEITVYTHSHFENHELLEPEILEITEMYNKISVDDLKDTGIVLRDLKDEVKERRLKPESVYFVEVKIETETDDDGRIDRRCSFGRIFVKSANVDIEKLTLETE